MFKIETGMPPISQCSKRKACVLDWIGRDKRGRPLAFPSAPASVRACSHLSGRKARRRPQSVTVLSQSGVSLLFAHSLVSGGKK